MIGLGAWPAYHSDSSPFATMCSSVFLLHRFNYPDALAERGFCLGKSWGQLTAQKGLSLEADEQANDETWPGHLCITIPA